MYSKQDLERIIYQIHEANSFLLTSKGWSAPQYGFSYNKTRNSKFMDALMKKGIIQERRSDVICVLGDWETVADGIFFTDKAIYMNSPKNKSNKKFQVYYDEISDMYYDSDAVELAITDCYGNEYCVDTPIWSKRNIKIFLEIAAGTMNFDEEDVRRLESVELPQHSYDTAGVTHENVRNASARFGIPRGQGFAAKRANQSLFRAFGTGLMKTGPLGRGTLDEGPSTMEKIDMLFKDVETEGKKQGYKRAAKEYEEAFKIIEKEYKETKELIESQKSGYGAKSDELIAKLSGLEKQKKLLEQQLERKARDVSIKFHIPIGDVRKGVAAGALFSTTSTVGILDLIYSYKEKKLRKAEQRGYLEAKELYEEKIAKMKKDLQELKKKGHAEIRDLLDMISDLFDVITEEQMKIADLKILL